MWQYYARWAIYIPYSDAGHLTLVYQLLIMGRRIWLLWVGMMVVLHAQLLTAWKTATERELF